MKRPPTDAPHPNQIDRVLDRGEAAVGVIRGFFASYFWVIFKNTVGWLLILLSIPAGLTLPGPGGLPMALIGFALVAFPGKRRITSHVLRGRPLRIEASIFTSATTIASLIIIGVLLYFVSGWYRRIVIHYGLDPKESTPGFIAGIIVLCVLAAAVTWGMMRLALLFVNKLIRLIPRIRRFIRPIMRKYGIVLLPPPKRGRGLAVVGRDTVEIIELSEVSRARFAYGWAVTRPWLVRLAAVVITATLFFFVVKPTVTHWSAIEPAINRINPIAFVAAVAILAVCLAIYRVSSWSMIVRLLAHPVAPAPATRVWATAELTRYLPAGPRPMGVRVALAKLIGIPPEAAAAAFVLEGAVFLIANVAVGGAAMLWKGLLNTGGDVRWWMIVLLAMFPALILVMLQDRVFYRFVDRLLVTLGRTPVQKRLGFRSLLLLLVWNIMGLIVASLALWLILQAPLALPLAQWWVGAAAYCVAWVAGYLAAWAPAGLGVREIVFMGILLLVLPEEAKLHLSVEGSSSIVSTSVVAFAGVLALIVRVWSVAGEVCVALAAYAFDARGGLESVRGQSPARRRT